MSRITSISFLVLLAMFAFLACACDAAADPGNDGDSEDADQACVICSGGLFSDRTKVCVAIACPGQHAFHSSCIQGWRAQGHGSNTTKCPVCVQDMGRTRAWTTLSKQAFKRLAAAREVAAQRAEEQRRATARRPASPAVVAVPAQRVPFVPAGPQYLDLPAVIEVSGIARNSYSGKFQYGDPNGLYVRTTVEAMRVMYHMKYPSGYDLIGGLTDDRVVHTCYVHVKNFNSQPSHYIAVGNHNGNFPGHFYWEMYATGEWREKMNRETVDDMRHGRGARGFMQQHQGRARPWNQIRSLLPQCQYYCNENFAYRSHAITEELLTGLVSTEFPRLMGYIEHLQKQLKGANKEIFQEAVWLHVKLCELTHDKRQAAQAAVVSQRDALASANAGLLAQLAQLQAQLARQAGGADDEKMQEKPKKK